MDDSHQDRLTFRVHPARHKELDAIRSSPEYVEGMQRLRRISARPRLVLAFIEKPLPEDLLAVVYLNQDSTPSRYAVVSRVGFDDQVLMGAELAARGYEMHHEDDASPVRIELHRDGRVAANSAKYGASAFSAVQSANLKERARRSRGLLARIAEAEEQEIAGYGRVRIVRLD